VNRDDLVRGLEFGARFARLSTDPVALRAAADALEREPASDDFARGVARAYRIRAAEIEDEGLAGSADDPRRS
jgi:hypothetical protein